MESQIKTEKVSVESEDPKVQELLKVAEHDLKTLGPMFNRLLEQSSAGGVKRILKTIATFQDVKLKKEEFELHALTEHLLKSKLSIMLTAAHQAANKQKEEGVQENESQG
jgi:hypothetical protein